MVIDEIYTYISNKKNKFYIWTAIAYKPNGEKLGFYHLSHQKTEQDLWDFLQKLPQARIIYSDENPTYKAIFGNKNIAKKGIKTNLIESLNSQVRQYCSFIKRKSKCFAKKEQSLNNLLAKIFISKII
jgi:IS1 family transposase